MQYYDISLHLSADTVRWVGSAPFELVERRRMARGDQNNSSALSMSGHAGTHLDAPFHFVPDGATMRPPRPLCRLFGAAQQAARGDYTAAAAS